MLGHVGADNVKGGEAQANLIVERFPDGAKIVNLQGQPGASPAIDRNQGVHNILDPLKDKYEFVAEQTANFAREEGASVTEAILAGLDVAAGRHRGGERRHGARARCRWCRSRGSTSRSSASTRCRRRWRACATAGLLATIEQLPGGQSRGAMDAMVKFLREGTKPEPLVLLTPIAITKDNLDKAERLGEAS